MEETVDYGRYKIIDTGLENFSWIRLTDKSPYPNVVYQYGKVSFEEISDSLKISFEFEVKENPNRIDYDTYEFHNYIGDILWELFEKMQEAEEE